MPLIILAVLLCIVSGSSAIQSCHAWLWAGIALGQGTVNHVPSAGYSPALILRQILQCFVALCIAFGQMLIKMLECASDTVCKRRGCCVERSCQPHMRQPTSS